MKKQWILIPLIFILVIMTALFVLYRYELSTPEYALYQTMLDVEEQGFEGLQAHLTRDANEKLDSWFENTLVQAVMSFFVQDTDIEVFRDKIQEMEWTVQDILKGKEQTQVVMGFQYEDALSGTISITMIQEDGEWKINSVTYPSFD